MVLVVTAHLLSTALLCGVLAGSTYVVAVLDRLTADAVAGRPPGWAHALVGPARSGVLLLLQQRTRTERPDAEAWALAPALLFALAAVSLTVVPVGPGLAIADVPDGLVLFGAAAALITIAVFLHGWSPNSPFPLIAAYRFLALALSFEIPFFLVLIATALPAESLAVSDIIRAQEGGWNVLRQPLGLPVYLVGGLGVAFWGPLAVSEAEDLAGGTLSEVSGVALLLWHAARSAVLVSVAAMGTAAFLGGWMGPLLPPLVWFALKTLALLFVLLLAGHRLARVRLERFVTAAWTILIPLALLDVFISGIILL